MRTEGDSSLYISEPVGKHPRYPPMVVDCSLLAAVLFDEPESEAAPESLRH